MTAATADAEYQMYVKGAGNQLGDCPFCQRVLLTCEEKGVKYKRHYIDFSNKPSWLTDVNPEGSVPVLQLPQKETETLSKDKWLISSDDIADYLETKHSQPKLGKHAEIPQVATRLFPVLPQYLKASGSEEAEKQKELEAELTQLDSHLTSTGPFLTGESLSAGDLALAPKLYHTQIAAKHYKGFSIPAKLKAVHSYMERMQSRPSWKATMYPPDLIIAGWQEKL